MIDMISSSYIVLSFRASETVNNRRHFEGVFRYAREHGWHVHAFEYLRSELDPLYWHDPESGAQTGLKELLDFWQPDGCVVDCGSQTVTNYPGSANLTHLSSGDFPQLMPGDNEVTFSNASSLVIEKRERFL